MVQSALGSGTKRAHAGICFHMDEGDVLAYGVNAVLSQGMPGQPVRFNAPRTSTGSTFDDEGVDSHELIIDFPKGPRTPHASRSVDQGLRLRHPTLHSRSASPSK